MTNLSSLVEAIARQALGGQQQNQQQQNTQTGGLGGILGSVLGQVLNQSNTGQQTSNNAQNTQQNNQSGLGSVLGSVLGQLGQGMGGQTASSTASKTSLLIAVLPVILAWIQKQGGIQGALDKLKQAGLGSQVQSWVNPDAVQNDSIKQEQVQQLFDDEDISRVAAQTDEPKQDIYSAIATVLPQIIDSLTPNGEKTSNKEADNDVQDVLNAVSNLLTRKG